MSWHCAFCGSTNNKKKWTHITVSFIDGGIPINMVAHAECLKEKTFKEADNLHEEIDSKIEDINEAKKDLKDIKKMLIEHINGLEF